MAAISEPATMEVAGLDGWLASRHAAYPFAVTRVPFADLDGWHFDDQTGNLAHRSGRFYTVEGLRVRAQREDLDEWHQPIIVQPEVGILGLLMRRVRGEPHFLMQAKMEPGNRNLLQLSPTVQATRSNYMRVHRGARVKYLEYFRGPRRGKMIADALQSEHGWWFYRKRNRNMIVEVDGDVAADEDFRWMSATEIGAVMGRDNAVNMDSRSVLAHLPSNAAGPREPGGSAFQRALSASRDPRSGSLTSTPELLSWVTGHRADEDVRLTRINLRGLPGWRQTATEIARDDGRHFRVVGVGVRAGSREVARWSQPLLEPSGCGIAAVIVKEFGGVLHLLVHLKDECGFLGGPELGPTVQCRPGNYDESGAPAFLPQVLHAEPGRIRFDAVHSEEGGRFLNAESRYMVVEAADDFPRAVPDGYGWVTLWQLSDLLRHGGYVQMQARSLAVCLNFLGNHA
jgi:oxidase EvaA